MTTIAIKDNIMCSDTQCSMGDMVTNYTTSKVQEIDGYLVGGAGRYSSILKFQAWFEDKLAAETGTNSWKEFTKLTGSW